MRKYRGSDSFWLPFKTAPVSVVLLMVLTLLQSILPTAVAALATAFFVDTAIKVFAGNAVVNSIYLPFAILLLVVFVSNVLSNLPNLIGSRISFALERKFAPAILDARANLAYKHIEDASSWELVERISDKFTSTLQGGVNAYSAIIGSVVSLVSVLSLIVFHVWWAVPVAIGISIPIFAIAIFAGQKLYQAEVDTRKYERRYSYYTDILTSREATEERMLFGYAENVSNRFVKYFETARKIQLSVSLRMYIMGKSIVLSTFAVALLITLTLINPVILGNLSPGMFMGIVAAVFVLVKTLGGSLQSATENLSKAKGFMNDLTQFVNLDYTKDATELPDEQPLTFESIEFRDVSFKYPTGENYILDKLSFRLEAGNNYSFVGANGAGKTTITKLLTGLYDDYDGEILINEKELRTYTAGTLKAMFSMVYQDYARYQISMADNIALGDVSRATSAQEVYDAAVQAGLTETLTELKEGINTPLGKILEGAVDISGGQWQKVAIARSIFSHAPIVIFDEPTAALDPIAESNIYCEFHSLTKEKTTIFINHRLGSTKLSDEILVIDKGCIVERGNQEELIKHNGLYAQMFEAQRKWYE
jgi:ATP-binding cassette subfamily B protein